MKTNILKNKNHEIEFLRAISVLFVVFFHFNLFNLDGGFVGVDIFFVISGYLITSIILQTRNFNLYEFYLKRLRRLLPIILLTVLISIVVGLFILSPIHLKRLMTSSLYSIFGISNFLFFSEAGYFDHEKLFKPLLHTWSLAVEIQFYFIWPIIILLAKNLYKRNIVYILLLIFISSILLSVLYSPRADSFFYFTGFRIYEFAVGSILFFVLPKTCPKRSFIYFFLGLSVIFFSAFFFNSNFSFPGVYALVPCSGAALVIYSRYSETKNFGKYLKHNIIQFLGSKSYTIYMLHWPFLIFYSYQKMGSISYLEKILLIILIIIFSNFIYKYFEKPFRYYKNKNTLNFNKLLLRLFLFVFAIIILSQYLIENKNFNFLKNSFYKDNIINTALDGIKKRNMEESQILSRQVDKEIFFNGKKNKKRIMLLGNSHAFDFYMALNTISSIKNIYDIDYIDFEYLHCFKRKNLNDKIIEFINFKILNRINSCKIVFDEKNFNILKEVDNLILGSRWPINTDFSQLIKYFKKFNTNIIIVGNGQKFYDVPTLYFKRGDKVNKYAENFNNDLAKINEKIKFEAKSTKTHFFDKSLLNCNPNCVVFIDNKLLYSDKDHWSYDGAEYFGRKIQFYNFKKLLK
tara:strand:- start:4660 stop:6552 length:1893 start_codon:yes stop_codon:yes gene_type:complete